MNLIKPYWIKPLEDFVSATKNELIIATPFFSSQILGRIFTKCDNRVKIKLLLGKITAQTLSERTTDPDIIKEILNLRRNVKCKCIANLHAKVLVSDGSSKNPRAIVTSANLTSDGLERNIEFGLMIEGTLAKEIHKCLMDYWNDPRAETLSKEKFFRILKESEKVKKTRQKCNSSYIIGKYVSPKGVSQFNLVVNEYDIEKIIEEFRQERGFGYPRKEKEFCKIQKKLMKIKKRDLNKKEIAEILYTIDNWTGGIRKGNMKRVLANNIRKINGSLKILLKESEPLANRINLLLNKPYKLNGMSLGIISTLLYVSDFESNNIYNERVLRGITRIFGPEIQRVHDGETYETFNSIAMHFRKLFDLQPMETDWILSKLSK